MIRSQLEWINKENKRNWWIGDNVKIFKPENALWIELSFTIYLQFIEVDRMISDNPSTAPCLLDKEGDRQLGNNILRISELDSSEEQEAEAEEEEEEEETFSFSSPLCPTVNKRAKHREDRILEVIKFNVCYQTILIMINFI